MKGFNHYRRPYLVADRVERVQGRNALEVCRGSRRLILSIDGDLEIARETIDALRNPESTYWTQALDASDDGLSGLLEKLDHLGWVGEADTSGEVNLAADAVGFDKLVFRGVEWLKTAGSNTVLQDSCPDRDSYRDTLSYFAERAEAISRGQLGGLSQEMANANTVGVTAMAPSDMAAEALELLLRRWHRTSPLALQLVSAVFRSTCQSFTSGESVKPPELDQLALTMSDPGEVTKQIWAAESLIVLSAAKRYHSIHAQFVPPGDLAGPGLKVLVEAEAAAEQLMMSLGRSPLLLLLEREVRAHRCAVGIYLHQYFITIRYIEAVMSFLRYRLREPLRKVGIRYLLEEVGHEVHELQACIELGVNENEVAEFAPLPFFSVYPEVLSLIAEEDPLAFCLAVTVAEGLPGAPKPIPSALAARGMTSTSLRSHQMLDEQLEHALFTRRLLLNVPWVDSDVVRRSFERFLFVVELSQLCWSQLAHYADATQLPLVPRVFGISAQDMLSI